MPTIESHTETADGYVLVVRIPNARVEQFAGVSGDAQPDGSDVLFTTSWSAAVEPAAQRRETRLLVEHALAEAEAAPAEPIAVTPPGTEL